MKPYAQHVYTPSRRSPVTPFATTDAALQQATRPTPAIYQLIQLRICAELGVDTETVADEATTEDAAALRAFEHLAYLWSDPTRAPEGRYDAPSHGLVWNCTIDVYILHGVPEDVPIRMRAIAAEAARFIC
ncbi:MAG TPA: hypothetical protein VJM32_02350 [Candidatus Saccharimonadales bacterium]|nr:hypothetical protein [Candidatus Saccharimonadales bacterium]